MISGLFFCCHESSSLEKIVRRIKVNEKYIIKKILNNNVVFSKNRERQDIILTGLGIGYQMKRGQYVDNNKIERVFTLSGSKTGNKLSRLLEQIPMDYFFIANKIKSLAESKLEKELSDNIYVTLCDHIYYAAQRLAQGLVFKNQLMWEIKRFYAEEYKIAIEAIDIINTTLKIELPIDEASFLALHIINAEINGEEIQSVVDMTKRIKDICNIVQYEFSMEFDEDSLIYTRFILHLKFFSQRLLMKDESIEEADFLYEQVMTNMPESFACVKKIVAYIQKNFSYTITKSEEVYLSIHIQRLITKGKKL